MKSHSLKGRVYSLDALRAIMMLLGLVIHTVVSYTVIDMGTAWPLKAKQTGIFFDVLLFWVHFFRMPVFFVAAGFFGALLYFKKGPRAMLMNRVNRILLPLLAGIIIIWPMVLFTFSFSNAAIAGDPQPFKAAWGVVTSGALLPINLGHMWFLYNLIIYSVICWALAQLFRRTGFAAGFTKVNRYILERPLFRIGLLSVIFFYCLYLNKATFLETNTLLVIKWNIFFNYFMFYGLGWMIYQCDALDEMDWQPVLQLVAATAFYIVYFIWITGSPEKLEANKTLVQVLAAVGGTLYVYGFLALFLRYFSHYSKPMAYLMDSAYYVYLVHVPVAAFMPGLLAKTGLPLTVEYLLTISLTVIFCFSTYHFLVRNSFVGRFLNGKMFKKIQADEEVQARAGREAVVPQ